MFNMVRAELFRLSRKKSNYVFFLVIAAAYILLVFLIKMNCRKRSCVRKKKKTSASSLTHIRIMRYGKQPIIWEIPSASACRPGKRNSKKIGRAHV